MSRREKILFGLVGLSLFAFANLIAGNWWSDRVATLEKRHHQNELELIQAEATFQLRDVVGQQSKWLDEYLGGFPGQEQADALLLENIDVSAAEAGIIVEAVELLESPDEKVSLASYPRSAVSVRASGSLDALVQWLHTFQQPSALREFRHFQLDRAKGRAGILQCRFQCWQWYGPTRSASEQQVSAQ